MTYTVSDRVFILAKLREGKRLGKRYTSNQIIEASRVERGVPLNKFTARVSELRRELALDGEWIEQRFIGPGPDDRPIHEYWLAPYDPDKHGS